MLRIFARLVPAVSACPAFFRHDRALPCLFFSGLSRPLLFTPA